MDNINKMIEKTKELTSKHEELENEILNSSEIPQNIKDDLIKIRKDYEEIRLQDEKEYEENKHRKIIGYNSENFKPIYENE